MLADHRYDRITDDIQSHGSDYPLPKYKTRRDADVEEYIGVFEDMGYFVKDNLITEKMAYDHFSYDIEKAWCNATVQDTIRKARSADKSKTAFIDPMYGNFEKLAKKYLGNEGQSCGDLDRQ
jgi:lysyl-tRNA synthetase class II